MNAIIIAFDALFCGLALVKRSRTARACGGVHAHAHGVTQGVVAGRRDDLAQLYLVSVITQMCLGVMTETGYASYAVYGVIPSAPQTGRYWI